MVILELADLGQDEIGDAGLGADGGGVPEAARLLAVRIGKGTLANVGREAEQDGNVLEGVEAVGDEEGNDDDVGASP